MAVVFAIYNREPTDVVSQHLRNCVVECFVWIRDYDIARSGVEHCNGRIFFQRS